MHPMLMLPSCLDIGWFTSLLPCPQKNVSQLIDCANMFKQFLFNNTKFLSLLLLAMMMMMMIRMLLINIYHNTVIAIRQ
jgi:hypothetical protein